MRYVLNSSQSLLQEGQENFSHWVYFSCFEKNILFSWFENKFFPKQENLFSSEKFSRPFCKQLYLDWRKWSQDKNNFLETRNIFFLRNNFFTWRMLVLLWDMFLIQVKAFCRREKKIFLSEFIFLVLRKIFLSEFWGFCSVHLMHWTLPSVLFYMPPVHSLYPLNALTPSDVLQAFFPPPPPNGLNYAKRGG